MSDPTPTEGTQAIEQVAALLTGNAPAEPETEVQGNPDLEDESLGDAGKKALDRMKAERNEAKKQAADFKAELDRMKAATMTDLERAQHEAKLAQEAAATAPIAAFREAAVIFGGIPADDADLFLTANDTETLKKQAARLVERKSTPTTPKPDPTQGAQQALALNGDELTQALARAVGAKT